MPARDTVKELPFDTPEYAHLANVRQEALGRFLDELDEKRPLRTALDVGCGVGAFTRFLKNRGMDVTGLDVRDGNIEEAHRRHPDLRFAVRDVEALGADVGRSDLVLFVGLVYHLENPFLALRNLAAVTGVCLYLESMVVDDSRAIALVCDEGKTESQARSYVAFVPSESCLIKLLYRAGFAHVYRPLVPRDLLYRSTLFHVRRRVALVAAHEALPVPSLIRLLERRSPKPSWERFPRLWRGLWAIKGVGAELFQRVKDTPG
jgi:SAM-dependent methyltransferase